MPSTSGDVEQQAQLGAIGERQLALVDDRIQAVARHVFAAGEDVSQKYWGAWMGSNAYLMIHGCPSGSTEVPINRIMLGCRICASSCISLEIAHMRHLT